MFNKVHVRLYRGSFLLGKKKSYAAGNLKKLSKLKFNAGKSLVLKNNLHSYFF